MNIAYWIIAGLLAVAFAGARIMKLARPREALASSGMKSVEDLSPAQVKMIRVAELLRAIGLIVPMLSGIAPLHSPIAALGLAVLMVGAIIVRTRRGESFVPPLVLGLLAAVVAVLG